MLGRGEKFHLDIMLYWKLATTLFLAAVFAGQSVVADCVDQENWCTCAWDNNHIKCQVQYNYFNATDPWIKTAVTNGDMVGDFYYTCDLESGNIRLDVKTCQSAICEEKRGSILVHGDNCYQCKKEGPLVNCEITIRNLQTDSYHDLGKCNDPRWYIAFGTPNWATLLAKTFPGGYLGP